MPSLKSLELTQMETVTNGMSFCCCRRFWIMQCSITSLHTKEWWRIWLRPLTFLVVSFLASTHSSWWVWSYILLIRENHNPRLLQEPGITSHMTVRPCPFASGTTPVWSWLRFGHRARPVLGRILRLPLRTQNPGFTDSTTCGLAEMVAFLMLLLQTQLARAYVLTILPRNLITFPSLCHWPLDGHCDQRCERLGHIPRFT